MTIEAGLRVAVLVCAGYLLLVYVAYAVLIVVALFENSVRRLESASQDYVTLATSRFTIPVTVILAAYDEEAGIVGSVRSLLAQDYPEFEVIVVNDGSRDGTLELLREEFSLVPAERFPRLSIETARVRGHYESALHPGLLVIDKDNGGKADALNAGINAARFRYVCGVDADAIFFPDALLRGMRLVLSDPARILGVTCHLAIAESPERMAAARPGRRPVEGRPLLAYQHLDYLRAFFNNRIAWSRLDFMLCAVGAFQIWRRDVLEELGGFARGFTCEDIELTFRIHERYLREGRDYRILCLPDTVGVTEGPDTTRKLVAQRERWQRVILETVWAYRRMLFRPRYKSVGMLGVPYYVLSEVVSPVFELLAIGTLGVAAAVGLVDWRMFVLVSLTIALVNGALTAAAVLGDDLQSRTYRLSGVAWLLALAPLDLFIYRPIIVWARLKGTWRFLRKDKGWHKFERNARPSAT